VQTYPEIPRYSLLVWWSDHTRAAVPGRYAEKGSSDDHQARPPLARGSAACLSLSDIPRSANESRDPSRTILDKVIAGHLEIFPSSEHPECGAWGRAVIMCPWCGRRPRPWKVLRTGASVWPFPWQYVNASDIYREAAAQSNADSLPLWGWAKHGGDARPPRSCWGHRDHHAGGTGVAVGVVAQDSTTGPM